YPMIAQPVERDCGLVGGWGRGMEPSGKNGRGGEVPLAAPGHDGMPVRSRPTTALAVWGSVLRPRSLSAGSAPAARRTSNVTGGSVTRPLSWASETTLRTFARAAMARSFRTQLCPVKPNVDTRVPRLAFRAHYAAVGALMAHLEAAQKPPDQQRRQ